MNIKKRKISIMILLLFSAALLIPIGCVWFRTSFGRIGELLGSTSWFYPKLGISLLYAGAIALGGTLVAFIAAFALVNGHFRFKNAILFLLMLLMLMPLQVTLLPNYIGLRDLHLLDTAWALILPMVCSPFAFFLMYQYMNGIPEECIEAARLETGSVAVILSRIMLPQMKGMVAAVFLFLFAEGFNMVEQPLYYVKKEALQPLSVVTASTVNGDVGVACTVGIVCLVPITILYILFDRVISVNNGKVA